MAKTSIEIIMSDDLKEKLHVWAVRTGKTVQEFAQEALYTYVEDVEDGVLGNLALSDDGLASLATEGGMPIAVDDSVHEARRKTA